MAGGKGNIKPEDGKQFTAEYQPQEKWTEEKALQLGHELIEWLKAKNEEGEDKGNIFFQEFLIIEKDLYEELIAYLSKKFTSFLKLLKKAEKIQELKLQKYGVGDRLNATMTKFVLTNKHGWKEKKEESVTNFNIEAKDLDDEEIKRIKDALDNAY